MAAAKTRGVRLGTAGPANLKRNVEERQAAAKAFAEKLRPTLEAMKARGLTQDAMVMELNSLGVGAAKGGRWHRTGLARVMAALA